MVDSPLVSIVTPTLNQVDFIESTLRSVAEQDYPRIEHIVIDGGSTDGTLDVLRKWGGRWISEPDDGQADAINKGVSLAAGEVFAWLNSDDVYLVTNAVSAVVDRFRSGARVVSGRGSFIDEQGVYAGPIEFFPDRLTPEWLRTVDLVFQPATFYTIDLARQLPLDTSLTWAFDWDFFIRLAERELILPVDLELVGYRRHGTGKTWTGGVKRQVELLRVLRRHNGAISRPVAIFALVVCGHMISSRLPDGARTRLIEATYNVADRLRAAAGVPGIPY